MLSETEHQFWEAFAEQRDEILALLLQHTANSGMVEGLFSNALSACIARIIPAYGRYRLTLAGLKQIFGYESAEWEYRFYDDGNDNRGAPSVTKDRPYSVPGVALVAAPDDEFTSGVWELYWLEDGTLLAASKEAHHLLIPGNQSSTLEISSDWIERTFKQFSVDKISSYMSVSQRCRLSAEMLSDWRKLNKQA